MGWNKVGWARACAWGIGCALLVSACNGSDDPTASMPGAGGSGNGGGAGMTPSSVTDLDGILAGEGRGYCARLFRCSEGNDDFLGTRLLLKTPAACEALLADINAKSFSVRDLRRQLEQGALQIVPAKAQACLDDLAACNGTDSFSRGSCRDMFEGQVAQGSPCQRSEDCAGDAYCDNPQCPGTCKPRKASGESCQGDDECTQGDGYTFCDRDLGSGAACRTLPVAAKVALGQPCTRRLTDAEKLLLCVDTLWCGPVAGQPSTATLGTCQPPIATGSACSDYDDVCEDSMCDTSTGVCRAVSRLEHAGEACDKRDFLLCDPLLGLRCSDQGSCEASGDGKQGSICFTGDFQRTCDIGLFCQPATAGGPGTCQPLLETGASCEQSSSCEAGNCQTTCRERPCAY